MNFLAARRRQPVFALAMLLFALVAVGGVYAAVATVQPAQAALSVSSETQVEMGKQLYLQSCVSCHSLSAAGSVDGPTLLGVGAAAVDFQVSTGRMPLAAPGVQAVGGPSQYNVEQTAALAAYIASLAPGPAIPNAEQIDFASADIAEGGTLFRTNCAQCHQAAGQGGALTEGKYAPNLMTATPTQMYEAMVTGPESMPIFSNATLPVNDKKAIIAYIDDLQTAPDPGGLSLGRLGPVTEGLFLWTAIFGVLIAVAVWIGVKAR